MSVLTASQWDNELRAVRDAKLEFGLHEADLDHLEDEGHEPGESDDSDSDEE